MVLEAPAAVRDAQGNIISYGSPCQGIFDIKCIFPGNPATWPLINIPISFVENILNTNNPWIDLGVVVAVGVGAFYLIKKKR